MKKISIPGILLTMLLAGSCQKTYLDRFPEDQPSSASYYSTADELTLAINSAYSNLSYAQDEIGRAHV
jgi:hypothetical protein